MQNRENTQSRRQPRNIGHGETEPARNDRKAAANVLEPGGTARTERTIKKDSRNAVCAAGNKRIRNRARLRAGIALAVLWAALFGHAALWGSRNAVEAAVPDSWASAPKAPAAYPVDFDALRAVNPDVIGWIRGTELQIDEPIVRAADNERYLGTGFDGEPDARGTVFLDCDCAEGLSGRYVLLYGHRLQTGGRFSSLVRLLQPGDFERLRGDLVLYTPDAEIPLRIIAVGSGPADAARRISSFASKTDFQEQVREWISGCALGETPEGPIDRLYTLITCSYDGPDFRLYVYAIEAGGEA